MTYPGFISSDTLAKWRMAVGPMLPMRFKRMKHQQAQFPCWTGGQWTEP